VVYIHGLTSLWDRHAALDHLLAHFHIHFQSRPVWAGRGK
jgi:hypothetical protein